MFEWLYVPVDGNNFALFRPASQSSTHKDASIAVDGIDDNDQAHSHTFPGDSKPWWKVGLAYPIWVSHVEITNRLSHG